MSGGHAPYIMPDGRPLRLQSKGSTGSSAHDRQHSGKADLWLQLQRNKVSASSEQELQEIRAIERVGHRRRRRWLNDKVLRDMAGPMSAQEMQSQFQPVPFGSFPPPSAFAIAINTPLWDNFRSIDLDKQAKVLERWEQHNRQQQQQQHEEQHASSPGAQQLPQPYHQEAAAVALERWRSISRNARAALKKANVHSVLELEMQVMKAMEQATPELEVLLELPDGFARLLVHGLAQFHGLVSTTCVVNGCKCVALHSSAAEQQQQQQQPAVGDSRAGDSSSSSQLGGATRAGAAAAAGSREDCSSQGVGSYEGGISTSTSTGAGWLLQQHEVTCSDVIMALQELGSDFGLHTLGHYMRTHVHGTSSASSTC